MKPIYPNKLGGHAQSAIMAPVTAALIAMRMGRAGSEHYHDLASAMMIASHVIDLVPRHRHLQADLQPALDALNAIFTRHEQRTIKDAHFSGTADELDALDTGAEIYRAIIKTTPGKTMLRAIHRVGKIVTEVAE